MKLHRNFLLAGLFIAILGGCKASTSPTGTTTTPGSMVATVNNKTWSSTVIPGVSGGAKAYQKGSILTVTGVSATDNTEITIAIVNPAVGSDSLGATGDEGVYSQILGVADTNAFISIPSPSFTTPYAGGMTITAYDTVAKTISGTFHFVGRLSTNLSDTVTVTAGSFDQVSW